MKLKEIHCPACGATLNPVNGLDEFYCMYCGNRIVLDGLSDAAYRAKADVRKYEHEEYKLQHESQEKDRDIDRELRRAETQITIERMWQKESSKNTIKLIAALALVCASLAALGSLWRQEDNDMQVVYDDVQSLYEQGEYDKALERLNDITSTDSDWKKKKEQMSIDIQQAIIDETGSTDVQVGIPSSMIIGMEYHDAVDFFKGLGFFKIKALSSTSYEGESEPTFYRVTKISIDGVTEFDKNASFPVDSQIIITYYDI